MKTGIAQEAVLAVDLGGTQMRVALVDRNGQLLARSSAPTRASQGPRPAMERLIGIITAMERENDAVRVSALGLSLAGPLDPSTGTFHNPPNLPGWGGFSPMVYLSCRLPCPVRADNDANLAALAEYRHGVGRGRQNLVFIIWGTGIGGGLVLDGRLYHGTRGFAGEVGHLVLEPQGPPCGCGGRGCLEALAAGPAIARHAIQIIASGKRSLVSRLVRGRLERVTGQVVTEADRRGDPVAAAAMEQAATYMGIGIAALRHVLDPEVVVVGGGVAQHAFHRLFPTLYRAARRHAISPDKGAVPVVPSVLGDDAGLIGAAALAWEEGERG